jgi:hypothetical protein
MEFYRAATGLVDSSVCVSPDVGHMFGTKGLVDFYVNDSRKWAVEILRDGGSVKQHVLRVGPGGLYSVVPISEKVILYFSAKKRAPKTVDVWYIQHTPDFSSAKVFRKGKEPVKILLRSK